MKALFCLGFIVLHEYVICFFKEQIYSGCATTLTSYSLFMHLFRLLLLISGLLWWFIFSSRKTSIYQGIYKMEFNSKPFLLFWNQIIISISHFQLNLNTKCWLDRLSTSDIVKWIKMFKAYYKRSLIENLRCFEQYRLLSDCMIVNEWERIVRRRENLLCERLSTIWFMVQFPSF